MQVKILCLLAFLAMATTVHAQKKIVCYYESWAKYRNGDGRYTINDIPAYLCTHVVYSFAGINTDGTVRLLDDASDLYAFTDIISRFPGVKPILSIGGASEPSWKFSAVVTDVPIRHRFVNNVVSFLQTYRFQGLDVDWEYPNQNGGRETDKWNFIHLLRELKEAFSGKGFSLSAAVAAEASSASQSYYISEVSKHVDFMSIMAYDFFGTWNSYTGMNAPMYPSAQDNSFQSTLNGNASVLYWLTQGAPGDKVILGLPFYGHSYTLQDPNNHGLYAPTSRAGPAGPYTGEAGTIGYNEMCVNIQSGGWSVVRESRTRVLYAYKGNEWVSYDDAQSIAEKCQYVKNMLLGGVMIWSVDTDDSKGRCGPRNILLSTVHNVLQ